MRAAQKGGGMTAVEGTVALYLRLSQEDMDIRKSAVRDEGSGIC